MVTELNKYYDFNHEACYNALTKKVLPTFSAKYQFGYLGAKIPNGSVVCLDRSDKDDWRGAKAVIQFRYEPTIGLSLNISNPIKLYCRNLDRNYTLVEVISDKGNFYSSNFLNNLGDVLYKDIPGYSWFARQIIPNIYLDNELIIDSDTIENNSFKEGVFDDGMRYLFKKLHRQLENTLLNP